MKAMNLIGATALALLLGSCGNDPAEGHGHDESSEHAQAEEARRGEHGGRLLEQGGYTVELAIAEDGTPPKYQAWLYEGDKPLPASAGTVEVRLKRLGDIAENHVLTPQADGSLMAASIVGEPHSFEVELLVKIGSKTLRWEYPSYEGRTQIAAKIASDSGIRVAPAGPGVIADEHEVQGLLTPMEGRIANVMARFPGPIRSLRANVGDRVRAGQALASVESNLSLTTYTVSAPISGVVLSRNASVGSV
ncbi:MAG: efflux transporter periplasmic adaptor subunit, partial [Pseudoxanthomonas sp.]